LAGEEEIDAEKSRWKVAVSHLGYEVYVEREIEKLGRMSKSAQTPKRFSFLKKKQDSEPDYRELREEFRAFLQTMKENTDLYLWFALSNLAEREMNRKLESKVYHLFGDVASTFLFIQQNFDPSRVTSDLLTFLKDKISRIASPGAFDITGNASTVTQSGEHGEKLFLDSVNSLQKMLTEVRYDLSKYFKKDEAFGAASNEVMRLNR